MFEMKELKFELSDLEPYISAKTMDFHYNKHYKGYVDKLNELIAGTPYEKMSLERIIKESYNKPNDKAIYNNAGQVYNHQMFWESLSHKGAKMPPKKIMDQIEASFESYDSFKKIFKTKALAQFGSGWCWVVQKDNKIDIVTTSNADNPLSLNLGQPVIVADVWEHAYYLDYQNRRAEFIETFLDYLVKW